MIRSFYITSIQTVYLGFPVVEGLRRVFFHIIVFFTANLKVKGQWHSGAVKPNKLPSSSVFFLSSSIGSNNEPRSRHFCSPQVVQEVSLKGRRCIISRHAKWLPVTLTETFWKRFSKLNHRDRKKINKKRKNGNNRENDCRRQQSRAAHCVVGRHVAAGRSKKNDGEKDFAALLPLRRLSYGDAP